jgi:hypothetical protein
MRMLMLLTRLRMLHFRLAALFTLLIASGIGEFAFGWRGALLVPLVSLVCSFVFLNLLVMAMLSVGKRAHRNGNHGLALGTLWVSKVPFFTRHDRSGVAQSALMQSGMAMAAKSMFGKMGMR